MHLRPARLEDAEPLAQLGIESFSGAFGHLYKPEDLATFLRNTHDPSRVAREIASEGFAHCLAEEEGELLGYCKMQLPSGFAEYSDARNPIALSQLYAGPGRTGKGIGTALMDWALTFANQQAAGAVQLSVYAENFGAHRFYEHFGFAKVGDITFKVGDHIDPEYLFELRLD